MVKFKDELLLPIILLLILTVIHYFGVIYFLYWKYFWFDMVTHFLGGAAVFTFVLTHVKRVVKKDVILKTIMLSMFIYIIWEMFEYAVGVKLLPVDALTDLVVDTFGAIFGLYLYNRIHKQS